VEKIHTEQGQHILISQDEIQKLEQSVRMKLHQKFLSEEEFRTRQNNFDLNRKQKIEQKLEAEKDKDLEGCTFKPVMETVNEGRRNFDQFL
jgi:hypothetical protein